MWISLSIQEEVVSTKAELCTSFVGINFVQAGSASLNGIHTQM